MTFKDSGRRNGGQSRKMGKLAVFNERQKRSHGIVWREIDDLKLRAAIGIATGAGATLSFTRANGGAGVMVKLYKGDDAASEFAGSASELNELLDLIIDQWASDEAGLLIDFKRRGESLEAAD